MHLHRTIIRTAHALLASVACVVVLFVTSSTADAALAGAPSLSTANRPDLSSVSVDGTTARWCFDKSLAAVPLSPRAFVLGGYGSSTSSSVPTQLRYTDAPGRGLGQSCVAGDFNPFLDDVRSYTFGSVGDGAVSALGGGSGARNRGDAVPLSGSDSRSGTRGFTAGPDLVGLSVDALGGTVDFVFDQGLSVVSDPNDFHVYAADGTRSDAVGVSVVGRIARAQFHPGVDLASAVRGWVGEGAVDGASGSGSSPNPLASAPVPGRSEATDRPDLVAADYAPSGNAVDFTFDSATPFGPDDSIDPAAFNVYLGDGSALRGMSARVLDRSRIEVEFGGTALTTEYLVRAAVGEGAIHATGTTPANSAGGVPLGTGAGIASGYTTGPDAVAVSFDPGTRTATITFDQRIFSARASGFRLLDASGTDIGVTASATSIPTIGPQGRSTVELRYTAPQLAAARALAVRGYGPGQACADASCPAVLTAAAGRDAGNVGQILMPDSR